MSCPATEMSCPVADVSGQEKREYAQHLRGERHEAGWDNGVAQDGVQRRAENKRYKAKFFVLKMARIEMFQVLPIFRFFIFAAFL